MNLLTSGRQRVGRGREASTGRRGACAGGRAASGDRAASAGGRGASAGGRGTVKATAAVARNAVRAVDAPLPSGGAGLAHQRAVDLTALLALAAARPGLWLLAGGALLALVAATAIALASGRLGPLARLDLAVVASTGLTVAAARVRRRARLS